MLITCLIVSVASFLLVATEEPVWFRLVCIWLYQI